MIVLEELRKHDPVVPVLVISGHHDLPHANEVIPLGAHYAHKPFDRGLVEQLVRTAHELRLGPLEGIDEHLGAICSGHGLTSRMTAIVRLAAAGLSGEAICQELGMGPSTLRTHVSAVLDAFDETSLPAAALKALRLAISGFMGSKLGGGSKTLIKINRYSPSAIGRRSDRGERAPVAAQAAGAAARAPTRRSVGWEWRRERFTAGVRSAVLRFVELQKLAAG